MEATLVPAFVEKLNANMTSIQNAVKEYLGVETTFEVKVIKPSHTKEQYVRLIETGSATTEQMTATPLLSHIFRAARLEAACYERTNTCRMSFQIYYEHTTGGSNGHDVADFTLDYSNGSVTER